MTTNQLNAEQIENLDEQKLEEFAQSNGIETKGKSKSYLAEKLLVLGIAASALFTACNKDKNITNNHYTSPTPVIINPPDSTNHSGVDSVVIIGGTGDSLIYGHGDTTLARRVTVGVGSFAESYVDPLGSMGPVNKMNQFDTIAVDLGYYDIPSNPLGITRSTLPQNALGRFDIANIDSTNNYQKPLFNAITAIGGFLPGTHTPDYSRQDVCDLVRPFLITAGTETKGVLLKGIDNITIISNQKNSKPLLEGALTVLSDVGTQLQSANKAFIIGGGLEHSNYTSLTAQHYPTVASAVGKMTRDVYFDVVSPLPSNAYDYYRVGLRAMENARGGDMHALVFFQVAQNDTASNRAAAKDFRDNILSPAREPAGITLADGFFGTQDRYNNLNDLTANKAVTGIIAKAGASHKDEQAAGTEAAKQLMAETRSSQQPGNIAAAIVRDGAGKTPKIWGKGDHGNKIPVPLDQNSEGLTNNRAAQRLAEKEAGKKRSIV